VFACSFWGGWQDKRVVSKEWLSHASHYMLSSRDTSSPAQSFPSIVVLSGGKFDVFRKGRLFASVNMESRSE